MVKLWEEWQTLYMKTCLYILIIYHSFLLRMRHVSDKSCRENQNVHFMFSNFFFRKSCCLWHVEKSCRARQATYRWQCDMAHALCLLDCRGYKQTLRIYNTYCFSMATVVIWMHLKYYIMCTFSVLFSSYCHCDWLHSLIMVWVQITIWWVVMECVLSK